MPRPGGEADKLGNRYEGVWTVDSLLDVLAAVIVEPLTEDHLGVEFVKELHDGRREFHSAKRQTISAIWRLS